MAQAQASSSKGVAVWTLVTGLAVGFVVGRETGGGGKKGEEAAPTAQAGKPSGGADKAPSRVYKNQADFPPGWLKEADLASVPSLNLSGMSDSQKVAALQAVNERDCECGCGMGSIATCTKKDPNCPRSPQLAKLAVEQAKAGKSLTDILAAIDQKQKDLAGGGGGAAPAAPAGPKKVVVSDAHPRRGPKAAKATIVEWSDFQCPFCKRAAPTVDEIMKKYPKDVAVIFRHQPLPFHNNAKPAAMAAVAAQRQGKFWEYHDKLWTTANMDAAGLEQIAKDVGLNMAKFKKDIEDPEVAKVVEKDSQDGNAVGANGTPTFFINGRELVGAAAASEFSRIIDEEIKKADDLIKAGTKPEDVYTKLMEQAAAAPPPAAPAPPAEPTEVKIAEAELKSAPVKGSPKAPVTIVEFSDFQCPFCSRVNPTMKQIEDEYKGKVKVIWKNYPLSFHQNAGPAAEAAMAAHEQGKFWEMHDKLFANQGSLDRASFEKFAGELGLNMSKFKAALDSGKFKDQVAKDMKYGESVGVRGTPAFFINGKFLSGAQPFDAFKAKIDEALK